MGHVCYMITHMEPWYCGVCVCVCMVYVCEGASWGYVCMGIRVSVSRGIGGACLFVCVCL